MKKEVYWPRVIRIKKKAQKNSLDDLKKKIEAFLLSIKNNEKKKMLESVYLNNLFYVKTESQLELLFNILKAINEIDRKFFVLHNYKPMAYFDMALPISHEQTISQPTTVARMLLLLLKGIKNKKGKIRVYEIGLGSGWNAALITYLLKLYKKDYEVHSVDRIKTLVDFAKKNISKLEKNKNLKLNLKLICEDGFVYIKNKKFDYIIFTAGIPNKEIETRIRQIANKNLKKNGRLIAPETYGEIFIFEKKKELRINKTQESYAFVPLLKGKILE